MRLWFWTATKILGEILGDLGLALYWAGKHGRRRCRERQK